MSKKNAENFLIAGGEDEKMRLKYDAIKAKEDLVVMAVSDLVVD